MARVGMLGGYFDSMISIGRLSGIVEEGWAVFDEHGEPVDVPVPKDVGPAALLVTDVTDALKRVDEKGHVVESVDRTGVWSLVAIVLNEVVLRRLEEAETPVGELMETVRAAGFAWQIRPISSP
jgi:hypothetical protein